MVYNPLAETVERNLRVNLYYTGLTETAQVQEREGPTNTLTIDRQYNITLPVRLLPRTTSWFAIK